MSRPVQRSWRLIAFVCAIVVGGLAHEGITAAPSAGAKVRVMFVIKGAGQDGGQVV